VIVEDRVDENLVDHGVCRYIAPRQPIAEAWELVRLMLGTAAPVGNGPWRRGIAGASGSSDPTCGPRPPLPGHAIESLDDRLHSQRLYRATGVRASDPRPSHHANGLVHRCDQAVCPTRAAPRFDATPGNLGISGSVSPLRCDNTLDGERAGDVREAA
jgi:hypothetical protein